MQVDEAAMLLRCLCVWSPQSSRLTSPHWTVDFQTQSGTPDNSK
ncbi:hypothetical protein L798_10737 [Zootermopsis nevadensis]|uniref:Uncharacterized protein n=1 Tax=Zootermopsis nevadensis TaxID=136037 RepID=A0A067QY96_ZOONE|nr:hypothetical protein L798_10737 [Zootermopsis nevadensis]